MQQNQRQNIPTDFAKLLQSRFGDKRGALVTAARTLNVSYAYLCQCKNGMCRPAERLVSLILDLPELPLDVHEAEAKQKALDKLSKWKPPTYLIPYIDNVRVERKLDTWEDAVYFLIEEGLKSTKKQHQLTRPEDLFDPPFG